MHAIQEACSQKQICRPYDSGIEYEECSLLSLLNSYPILFGLLAAVRHLKGYLRYASLEVLILNAVEIVVAAGHVMSEVRCMVMYSNTRVVTGVLRYDIRWGTHMA